MAWGADGTVPGAIAAPTITVNAFIMRKNPVTSGEYLEFLNGLVAEGQLDEAGKHCPSKFPGSTTNTPGEFEY